MIIITFIFTINGQRLRLYGKYITNSMPNGTSMHLNTTLDTWIARKIVSIFTHTGMNIEYPEINLIKVGILGSITLEHPIFEEENNLFDMVVYEYPNLSVYLRDTTNPFGIV
jgi:hypothetical protein